MFAGLTHAIPTDAEEIWRYSRVGDIDFSCFTEVVDVAPTSSWPLTAPTSESGRLIPADRDLFSELVARNATVREVTIPAGSVVREPITLVHDLSSSGGLGSSAIAVSRLVIRVGDNAEVTIVHEVRSGSDPLVFVPEVEFHVGRGAHVRYVNVQELGPQSVQVATQSSTTGRDGNLSTMAVALGGSYARLRLDATISDRDGHNELLAVYYSDGNQMHDFRTVQEHVAPRTSSDLIFKGAVAGHGRSVYSGLIKIGLDAKGTSANQTNRNLLLSPNASAESVPNLEIENNDVRCSHASAIGPIDEDELYYLASRGVPPEVAERLIVLGFFSETLSRIPNVDLRNRLVARIADTFDRRSQ